MLVELGPVVVDDVRAWTRFARRMIIELRVDPGDLAGVASTDLLDEWSRLIDEWATLAAEGEMFRWSRTLDTEVGEFLLHGLERCIHSAGLQARVTEQEYEAQLAFTMHVISAFVGALETEGVAHVHYADQIRGSFSRPLD